MFPIITLRIPTKTKTKVKANKKPKPNCNQHTWSHCEETQHYTNWERSKTNWSLIFEFVPLTYWCVFGDLKSLISCPLVDLPVCSYLAPRSPPLLINILAIVNPTTSTISTCHRYHTLSASNDDYNDDENNYNNYDDYYNTLQPTNWQLNHKYNLHTQHGYPLSSTILSTCNRYRVLWALQMMTAPTTTTNNYNYYYDTRQPTNWLNHKYNRIASWVCS